MRQQIFNLKFIVLSVLIMVVCSCEEKTSKETCLKYSTSFIEKESQRLINKINHYTNINPFDINGISCENKMKIIQLEYTRLSNTINTPEDIKISKIAFEGFYSLVKKNLGENKYTDSLIAIVLTSKEEIMNIASLLKYEVCNSLSRDLFSLNDVIYKLDYSYYSITDTIKLSEPFNAFVTYEIASTRNLEYKDYRVVSVKRNGKLLDKLDIKLAPNNRMFIIKPDQMGNYEVNLMFTRNNNISPYKTGHPMQIKFTVKE